MAADPLPAQPETRRMGRALPVTHRAVFATLPSADASAAVVRRLRSAIGLGLLADGERLPKEPELARQLGVSTFALRDALQILRDDGLIATKPGKFGGSFVQRSMETQVLAEHDLQALSSAQLRDLGDWRRMLAAQAAALAALRATDSNLSRLTSSAHAVAAAAAADDARRAYGRFHIEVAAAAQSTRLNRAELAMHEEFDWFLNVVLQSAEQRGRCSAQLLELTDAIRLQNVDLARALAERHVTGLVEQISHDRFRLLAAQPSSLASRPSGAAGFSRAAKQFANDVIATVNVLAAAGARALTGSQRRLRSAVLQAAQAQLEHTLLPLTGIGVIAETDTVPGVKYWMTWLERTPSGALAPANHVLDPTRDDFYDYENREYLAYPREHRTPWAMGPYVDYNGVDDYVVTVSVPIMDDNRFLGVAATDILAADMERSFSPWLADATGLCLLVNAEGRVLVSNSLTYSMGELVRSTAGLYTHAVGVFDWQVVTNATS
ncbi:MULTISPECIES: FCD domain-containing protein [unclassified Mycolicibacterium]|uniref:FCD domain-containing protein n=1 Tax=unclassified Mycolicibacterium TaxID=2636767 RepID=UPI001390951E|nr:MULTISPECIES: FCD domain-containing protein [unclassified Mycolicibacterium]